MKEYRFDYIKEMVEQWRKDVPKDANNIKGTPYRIFPPWIDLDENSHLRVKPAIDYYGEEIENMDEWIIQRNNYCEKLAKEYENNKTN